MSRKLRTTLKSLLRRNNTRSIRAVRAPITSLSTWILIQPRGRRPYYYNIETRSVSYAEPLDAVIIDSTRERGRMVAREAATRARYLARERRQAEIEAQFAHIVQPLPDVRIAQNLALLKTDTDNLRKIYDELYAKYTIVCKFHKLSIIELEDDCENCLCTIDNEVIMYPTAIRDQTKKAYEKHTITKWLSLGNTSDPSRIEKDPLTVDDLRPNSVVQGKIDEYKELMQKTINENPLPSDDVVNEALTRDAVASEALASEALASEALASEAVATGPRTRRTIRTKRTKRRRHKKKKKA
jgi:hypothetical protein